MLNKTAFQIHFLILHSLRKIGHCIIFINGRQNVFFILEAVNNIDIKTGI